jgi:hypothetical protein
MLYVEEELNGMSDLRWYACVYEGDRRIIYGRAPRGGHEDIVEDIKRSLVFHDLIGLRSKVFLRTSRLNPGAVPSFCEKRADKNLGDYGEFKVVKLDLRRARGETAESLAD